jgi:uncharacterized repeat protein (TIGR01451 family)
VLPSRTLLALLAIAALLSGLMPAGTALAASASLQLTLRTSFPVVSSGAWSVVNLDYRCASVANTPCQNVIVSAVLPPELSWAAADVQISGAGTAPVYSAASHTATWSFSSPINAGDSGTIELRVKFPAGSTPNGTTATLRAEIQASNAPTSLSNALLLTAQAQARAIADKTFVSGGVIGLPTTYQLSVCIPNGGSGSLNLSSVVITDTLPVGATFVSASNGGTFSAGVVSWPAFNLTAGSGSLCAFRTVTVVFNSPAFHVGDQVRNDMSATATALGGTVLSLGDFDIRPIQPPIPGMGFTKTGPSSAQVGDPVRYNFNLSNTGTTALDNVTMLDDPIPSELLVTRIYAGAHNLTNTLRLKIEYKTNLNSSWVALPGSPFTGAACVNVAPNSGGGCAGTLTLGGGEHIAGLRYSYLDPLPYGFQATSNPSGFGATVVSAPINQVIANTGTGSFTYNGATSISDSQVRSHVVEPAPPGPPAALPSIGKSVSPSVVYAGETVTYTLTLRNDPASSGGFALVNPMIADLLANSLILVPGSQKVVTKPNGAPDPVFEQLPDYNGTGKVLLRWRWDSYSLPSSQQVVLQFQARLDPHTPAGSISNSAALVRSENPAGQVSLASCQQQPADANDLDDDGNTGEPICSSTISSISLTASARTSSLKLVMGQLDSVWTRDPDTGLTTPGGMADYQLIITNTDSIALTQLVVVDILPWVGDSGVVRFDQPRGTQWRPYLIGPVAAPAGATVYYSTQSNPCRQPDLGLSPDSPGCAAPAWSTVPPADITTVQAIKLEFGGFVLQPGDSVLVSYPMRAPVGGTPGQIAWNSFGYRARDTTSGSYLLASEPPRVGIERGPLLPPAYGNYVWLDQNLNGAQDAGEPGVNGARIDLYRDTDGTPGPSAGDTWVGYTVSGPDNSGNPGYYFFSDPAIMIPGDFYARILPPPGYGLTAANAAGDAVDSDVDPATFYTPVTNLVAGEIDDTWDAGLVTTTAVGNYVWIDRNGDGIQNEPVGDGVNGITVRLYQSNGTLVGTRTTADDAFGRPGYYLFDNLAAGDYYVQFVLPSGFSFTTRDATADTADSDADPAAGATNGRTATFTLANKQLDLSRDAGLALTSGGLSLGDRVWHDLDNDGRYEPAAGETGIDGVKLNLYRDTNGNTTPDAGEYVGTSTTLTYAGIPGYYQFANLTPGSYIVVVDPSNFAGGGALAGLRTSTGNDPAPDPDDDVESDDNGALVSSIVRSQPITLSSGGEPGAAVDGDGTSANQTLDFGFVSGAALGDRVWFDTNADGVQDPGEPGVAGVTVELLDDASGSVLRTTTTDSQGAYGFTQLAAGTYRVRFSGFPAGYTLTGRDLGGDDAADSDALAATGETIAITLADGQTDLTWDAGLTASLASIGNFVWDDLDRDGIQDAGEPGIPGVTATLYDSAGQPIDANPAVAGIQPLTATTNASGLYSFTNLPPGDYAVGFSSLPISYTISPQHQGLDDTVDSDVNPSTGRAPSTRLSPGENDPTWDMGLYVFASIGDRVWSDTNVNGVQDAGEPGVSGVGVSLFRPGSSTPVATTSTDASGHYRFTNLVPGDYYLEFGLPNGYRASPQNQGADTADSDADPVTRQTITTTLGLAEDDPTWDFGIYPTASIGDRAWLDLNANGVQDPGETAGVPGVQVVLYDSTNAEINTTVTDASGAYAFRGLPPGDYSLRFILPPSYRLSPQDQGGNDTADSDVAAGTLRTIATTLSTGESDPTWDIGLYQPSSLGDRVWHDLNADGVQDPGEPGIAGVQVELLDKNAQPIDSDSGTPGVQPTTATTDASGSYSFANLAPGQYIVQFGATPGYANVSQKNAAAGTAETDSDADSATRRTATITLPSSTSDLSWDLGVYNLASLGDRVWLDTNVDGIQDAGETSNPGGILQGITVELWRPGGSAPGLTTTTDAGGNYGFASLTPGDYYLVFKAPAGYAITRANQGADDAADSDASPINGQTGIVSLQSGDNDLRWDAGIYQPATVGDRVWLDMNADGIQDAGETAGVENVRVELLQGASVVDYTYTDASGLYLFTNLFPGSYQVRFASLPAGYLVSPADRGADDTADSDASAASSMTTAAFALASGDDDRTHDLGLYQAASIGNFVWYDQNANGIQDVGEPGIAGVTVQLLDSSGAPVDTDPVTAGVQSTTTTNASGLYSFTGLTPGAYKLQFSMPAGYDLVSPPSAAGSNAANDSDIDRATRQTPVTNLVSGESDPTWDAGFYHSAKLGNYVWEDTNGNGVQNAGEPGVSGVLVTLLDGSGNPIDSDPLTAGTQPITATTDASGLYLFSGLEPGQYRVQFALPSGYSFTYNDIVNSEIAGANDTNDSDADRVTGRTIATTLVSNEDDRTWDAGIVRPAKLGDYAWEDANGNGVQDGGETGLNNVTVTLIGAGRNRTFGNGDDTSTTITTNASGLYQFANLQPGLYRVQFTLPGGYAFTRADQGADTADSDVPAGTAATGTTINITLVSAQNDTTWDAGFYRLLTLGNLVWNDANDNRAFDSATESGIDSVTVELYRDTNANGSYNAGTDTLVATTTTAGGGHYQFAGLTQGDYLVVIPASNFAGSGALRTFRSSDGGAAIDTPPDPDTNIDDDDNGGGPAGGITAGPVASSAVTLSPSAEPPASGADGDADSYTNLSVDFGFYSLSLGNLVWTDLNNNGTLDSPAETGRDGITVGLLYDANDNGAIDAGETTPIATTTTSNGGHYLFNALRDTGRYMVEVQLPAGFVTSTGTNGSATGPYEPAPSADTSTTDGDDNGTSASATAVRSALVQITAGGEPTGEPDTALPTGAINPAADNGSNLAVDFGIFNQARLGNQVWYDTDGNGIQNESPLGGVVSATVTLRTPGADTIPGNGDDTTVATTTTDASGVYGFANLIPGSYYLTFGVPSGYAATTPNVGANDTVDSDMDPATGRTSTVTLAAGANDTSWDLGIYKLLTLGNLVWDDANNNGVFDSATESGVDGVRVELYRDTDGDGAYSAGLDTLVSTTTTAAGGHYQFTGLIQGSYVVVIPASNFASGQPLDQYRSSTGTNGAATGAYEPAPDPDTNVNDDDNGTATAGLVASRAIDLNPSAEPPASGADGDADADTNLSVDFGFFQPLSLGNLVWDDVNNNGAFDSATESGVDGVRVELYRDANANGMPEAGELVAFTTTSGGGAYRFDNLIAGDYIAVIPAGQLGVGQPLDGYISSTGINGAATGPNEGPLTPDVDTVATDGDDNGTTAANGSIASLPVTLSRGAEPGSAADGDGTNGNQTVDFGFFKPTALGDRVWHDQNGDGVQDAGEPGIGGATVTLRTPGANGTIGDLDDTTVLSTTTDASGIYAFTNLSPGSYYVQFSMPAGYDRASPANAPSATGTTNSDADRTTLRTAAISLAAGQTDLSWDMGVYQVARLGDYVWEDTNGNGLQDAGEPGVPGVAVGLLDAGGTQILTATTDASGLYLFDNLDPGQYSVVFTPPSGYSLTYRDVTPASVAGATDANDSDADQASGCTIATTLVSGEDDRTWDAGIYRPAAIGNRVWEDLNGDGHQDTGEPGVSGVTVTLRGAGLNGIFGDADDISASTTTSASGAYGFGNLAPGDYSLAFSALPANFTITRRDQGADDADSDADPSTGATIATTLVSGESDPTWDAGIYQLLSVGNRVWEDLDNNGKLDAGEPGVDGVTVNLYRDLDGNGVIGAGAESTPVATTTTSNGGAYLFSGLPQGSYLVEIKPPAGYISSTGANGAASGPYEGPLTPDPDTVAADGDDNGDTAGGVLRTRLFTLAPGAAPLAEPDTTLPAATTDPARDENGNLTIDFGIFRPASIGDRVWLDQNGDGQQTPGEPGLPGMTVQLWRAGATAPLTTTTGVNGDYGFSGLASGDYQLVFVVPTGYLLTARDQGADTSDSDADPQTGRTATTTLTPGEDDPTWDAGMAFVASIGDRVWLDRDANGLQEAGEPGIPGVTVQLYSPGADHQPGGGDDTLIGSTTTDVGGFYGFANLPQGEYFLTLVPPAGYVVSPPNQGTSDSADSDVDPVTFQTSVTTISFNEVDPTWDLGLYRLLSLGDFVWNDLNNNGQFDPRERPIANVGVELYRDANHDDQPGAAELISSTTTLADGSYLFGGLIPGDYIVLLPASNFASGRPLNGYRSSTGAPGTNLDASGPYEPADNGNLDIDNQDHGSAAGGAVRSSAVTLASGTEPITDRDTDTDTNRTIDFGFFMPAALGSTVWEDRDHNGQRDPGEPGVPGVIVTLYDSSGTPIAQTTTDSAGYYSFVNLPPDSYSVGFDVPSGMRFTTANAGDDSTDSDADPATGHTGLYVLVPGQNDLTAFAGLTQVPPTAIALRSFTAERAPAGIRLRWSTAAELNTWGYTLYRSADGTRAGAVRITPQIIPATGHGGGADYTWLDTGAAAGQRYSYWLVETELSGRTAEYGPVTVASQPQGAAYRVSLPIVRR